MALLDNNDNDDDDDDDDDDAGAVNFTLYFKDTQNMTTRIRSRSLLDQNAWPQAQVSIPDQTGLMPTMLDALQ